MSLTAPSFLRRPLIAPAASAAVSATTRMITAAIRMVAAEIDRRRTAELLNLDDHLLADIGITRGEVSAALLATAGEKPSDRLARGRDERRRTARLPSEEAVKSPKPRC